MTKLTLEQICWRVSVFVVAEYDERSFAHVEAQILYILKVNMICPILPFPPIAISAKFPFHDRA